MTDDERQQRDMVAEVIVEAAETEAWTGIAAFSPEVVGALAGVPRHLFVPDRERSFAYINHALPIGHGQTISQPYMVALMTELLRPQPQHRVLEIGTGSGYQAAVLARLVARVFSVERIPALAAEAEARLARLGIGNVEVRCGDGNLGWPEQAPFDGIVVTAGARRLPPALLDQLRPGARMVIPLGDDWSFQHLVLFEKDAAGFVSERRLLPVAFVPLV